MKGRQVGRVNQHSLGETPLVSGVLQRAVADKEGEGTQEVKSGRLSQTRFVHDFSQMPIDRGGWPKEVSKIPNQTGLPDALKAGVENLSGYSLHDVKVHYNSPKPAQLQALAYTQGTEIHVAPGQEEHIPHEAWHVVQQMQGRVKPIMQIKGIHINNDEELEREADVMGQEANAKKQNTLFRQEDYQQGSRGGQQKSDQELAYVVQHTENKKVPLDFNGYELVRKNTACIQRMRVYEYDNPIDLDKLTKEELANILWRFSFSRETISLEEGENEAFIIEQIKNKLDEQHQAALDIYRDRSRLQLTNEDFDHILDRHYNYQGTLAHVDTPSQWLESFIGSNDDYETFKGIGSIILERGELMVKEADENHVILEGYFNFGHKTGEGYNQDGVMGTYTGARAFYHIDLTEDRPDNIYLTTVYPKGGFSPLN